MQRNNRQKKTTFLKKISFSFEASKVMNANLFFINLIAEKAGRDTE